MEYKTDTNLNFYDVENLSNNGGKWLIDHWLVVVHNLQINNTEKCNNSLSAIILILIVLEYV